MTRRDAGSGWVAVGWRLGGALYSTPPPPPPRVGDWSDRAQPTHLMKFGCTTCGRNGPSKSSGRVKSVSRSYTLGVTAPFASSFGLVATTTWNLCTWSTRLVRLARRQAVCNFLLRRPTLSVHLLLLQLLLPHVRPPHPPCVLPPPCGGRRHARAPHAARRPHHPPPHPPCVPPPTERRRTARWLAHRSVTCCMCARRPRVSTSTST